MNELSLKDNLSEEDFKKAINTEYEFIEFYKLYLESIREGHGLPTTEIYNIAETFISSSIRSHELKLSKKRSIDDTHAHMKFQQVSTASSSTETYPVASPSPVVSPTPPKLKRNDSGLSEKNLEVHSIFGRFFKIFY